ncbi:phage tail protein, partial [Achromobacter xylosoxidans]
NRGSHWFSDYSATQFRVPDLRDMFRRFTGTDADTANARAMGTRQADTFRRHSHRFQTSTVTGASIGEGLAVHRNMMSATNIVWNNAGSTIDDSGGNETRPLNTAYHPRIHA